MNRRILIFVLLVLISLILFAGYFLIQSIRQNSPENVSQSTSGPASISKVSVSPSVGEKQLSIRLSSAAKKLKIKQGITDPRDMEKVLVRIIISNATEEQLKNVMVEFETSSGNKYKLMSTDTTKFNSEQSVVGKRSVFSVYGSKKGATSVSKIYLVPQEVGVFDLKAIVSVNGVKMQTNTLKIEAY